MSENDIREFQEFYSTSLGAVVCRNLRRNISDCWKDLNNPNFPEPIKILGLGYAIPYLTCHIREAFPKDGEKANILPIAGMPAKQGASLWPTNHKNLATLHEEFAIPFADSSIERVLLVHCLEFCSDHQKLLREIWRILTPLGRLLIIVPNRNSIWAQTEHTPFGYGRPYTTRQLSNAVFESMFTRISTKTALHLPPSQSHWIIKSSEMLQKIKFGNLGLLGGVIMLEAEKQIYANFRGTGKKKFIFQPVGNG